MKFIVAFVAALAVAFSTVPSSAFFVKKNDNNAVTRVAPKNVPQTVRDHFRDAVSKAAPKSPRASKGPRGKGPGKEAAGRGKGPGKGVGGRGPGKGGKGPGRGQR